ncbi:tubulin-specific chaperone C [Nerophis lumbriciformis]|uniref:tubulin-specific chaperone C n=1 Tax=Nerophis lumbriciformis TaxID=546530 RepID=UPI002ADF2AA9|nr:tubulin-specific chaperone C-like [Nerophis lumbriciformis]XP_061787756.1 tubulin-specific chaperone C-like [Nerophis lumbriciformis]
MDAMDDQADYNGAAKVKERLERRRQARIEDVGRRKEAKESHAVAKESLDYFLRTFYGERAAIEELLSRSLDADQPAAAARSLEEAADKTLQLQKFLNDSMVFLNTYEQRQAQAALQKLQTSLTETREQALPKKRFAFRARAKASDPSPDQDDGAPEKCASTQVDEPPAAVQCGFSHISDEVLTKTASEVQKEDVLLSHLSNCKVRLYGNPSTLHLKHIDNCEILCGPVSTSVFVDHCQHSTLALACQQMRTHNTVDTRVYLHVTSRAIVEDCRGVSFAPFSWSYPALEEHFCASGLDPDRNNWDQVDDFNWLAAGTPSPNWAVIPEAERRTTWEA